MPKFKPEQLLSPAEVAQLLGYRSTDTLAFHDAELQPVRTIGGHRRYRREVIEAVRAGRKVQPQTVQQKLEAFQREFGLLR